MDRRDFLRLTGAATATLALPRSARAEAHDAATAPGPAATPGWKTYETTTRVEVLKPSGATRVWVPTPLTRDTRYHRSLANAWRADGGTAAQWIDPAFGAGVVWAEFPGGARPVLELTSRFATRDIAVDLSQPGHAPAESRATLERFTAPTDLLPTDGVVKTTSAEIV